MRYPKTGLVDDSSTQLVGRSNPGHTLRTPGEQMARAGGSLRQPPKPITIKTFKTNLGNAFE